MATIKKGTYRFNDVINALPYETFEYSLNGEDRALLLQNYGVDIKPVFFFTADGITYEVSRLSVANTFGDVYGYDGVPTVFLECIVVDATFGYVYVSDVARRTFTILEDTEVEEVTASWFSANTSLVTEVATEDTVREKITSLITKANITTGKIDTDLTSAVLSLVEGYGVGEAPTLIEKSVAANGTYLASDDGADGYSQVSVDVPIPDGYIEPSGDLEITENGTKDVTNYASVTVAIPEFDGSVVIT